MGDTVRGPQAQELTKKEADELVRRCFNLERGIKEAVAEGHKLKWRLARLLWEFHQEQGWSLLGFDTIGEWLAQPEISMRSSTYYRAVQLWEQLAEVRKIPEATLSEVETSKAATVLPAIVAGSVKPERALDDAKALGWRDLRDRYSSKNKPTDNGDGPPDIDQPLDASKEPQRVLCPACGQWTDANSLADEAIATAKSVMDQE